MYFNISLEFDLLSLLEGLSLSFILKMGNIVTKIRIFFKYKIHFMTV